jgi:hypothetical protein
VKPLEKDALDVLVAAGLVMDKDRSGTLPSQEFSRVWEYGFVRRRLNLDKCKEMLQRLGFMDSLFIPAEGEFEYYFTAQGERFYRALKTQLPYRDYAFTRV